MKVVVIGGGIIGISSAYELLRRGHEVTVVDAGAAGAGASRGNAGWVVPAQTGPVPAPGMVLQSLRWMLKRDSPLYIRPSLAPGFVRFMFTMWRHCNRASYEHGLRAHVRLSEGTMDLLDRYRADGVDFEMAAQGLLQVFGSEHKFDQGRDHLELQRACGFEPRVLLGAELREQEPALVPGLHAGVYYPGQRHLRPENLTTALAQRCTELGGRIVEHAPVRVITRRGLRIVDVIAGSERFEADTFLLAAGAWTRPLARLAGVRLPIRPGKGYSLDYTPAPVELRSAVKLMEPQVALTPFAGAARAAGTMEFAGLDDVVNPIRVRAVAAAPKAYLQGWGDPEPVARPWAGARPMTPDGMPIIGPLAAIDNAFVASGHGMLGVTLGPATGVAVAEIIAGDPIPAVLEPFSPRRFGA